MKKFKPFMTLGAISLITLLSASTAFAATSNIYNSTTTQVQQNHEKTGQGNLTTVLDNLVSAGTMTQAQETTILNAFKPSSTANGTNRFATALDSLVTAGTITQDQETAIETALQSAAPTSASEGQQVNSGNGQSTN